MMKIFFIFFNILLAIMAFIPYDPSPIKLYLLSDHGKVGDHNQVLGIKRAFEKLAYEESQEEIQFEDVDTKKISSSEIHTKVKEDMKTHKVIVVGAGEGGIDGIVQFPKNPYLMICLTSHMFLERYKDPELLKKVMFLALPTHDPQRHQVGAELIETTGVAHNRQTEAAISTYENNKSEVPQASAYLGVALGGDAPTPTGEVKLFTKEDTQNLADYAIKRAQETNASVLVLNGPRTGKHTSSKQEISTAHRDGKLDEITTHFKEILEASLGEKRIKIFDFQFNTKTPYNSFDLVLGAIKANKGEIILPGESTTMISEAIDVMAPQHVIIYENSAMNEIHHAHITSEFQAGRAAILKEDKTVVTPTRSITETYSSAAEIIARELWSNMCR